MRCHVFLFGCCCCCCRSSMLADVWNWPRNALQSRRRCFPPSDARLSLQIMENIEPTDGRQDGSSRAARFEFAGERDSSSIAAKFAKTLERIPRRAVGRPATIVIKSTSSSSSPPLSDFLSAPSLFDAVARGRATRKRKLASGIMENVANETVSRLELALVPSTLFTEFATEPERESELA